MNPQLSPTPQRRFALQVALLAALATVCGGVIISGTAQSTKGEREFKNTVPAHVPVKVKLKNEQSFKDAKNKNWARGLEIEVKNTGSKPIYFLYMAVVMPDFVLEDGNPAGFQLTYGRKDLVILSTPIQPDDIPIMPGDSVTLKVSASQLKGFEGLRDEKKWPDPKRVRFDMQLINFGDGTGLRSTQGLPLARPGKRVSQTTPTLMDWLDVAPRARDVYVDDASVRFDKIDCPTSPASFLRVNFYPPNNIRHLRVADLCGCQNSNDCMWGYIGFPSCPCDDPGEFFGVMPGGGCANPYAGCLRVETVNRFCDTQYNGRQQCQFQEDVGNCAIGDPTPTPTPTPGPAGGDCDPAARPTCPYSDCNLRTGQWECCDQNTRPNSNCPCEYSNLSGSVEWECHLNCLASGYSPANFQHYRATGCAPNSYNEGNCCKCYNQNPTCPSGFTWDKSQCKCCNSSGQCTETVAGGGGSGCDNPPLPDGTCADGSYVDATGCCGGDWTCNPYCCQTGEGCNNFGDPEPPPLTDILNDSPSLAPNPNDDCCDYSPILVDVSGDGFDLTGAHGGVRFDMRGDGRPAEMSWTRSGSDDSWLFLDRDGNGVVDNGKELFGNYTEQPRSVRPNGFRALAQFDKAERGGNGDGWIDSRDGVFASLRLWRDANHNGVSEPGELHTLPSFKVVSFSLDYKTSLQRDRHGNRYRYRAPVRIDDGRRLFGRWAWDVFLVEAQ